ncbi:MAG TPA: hypothetical protein DEA08_37320 [Planctomycetes bacterium]|nr:hypothetical protein [Planctomycetota bacterium]
MSATPTLLRLRPLHSAAAPARRRWLLAACALLSLLLGVFALRRASSPASEEELLRVALAEARENCLAAELASLGEAHGELFRTEALLAALDTERVREGAYGELPALRREARWLASVQPGDPPAGRSWEDVRFLAGALHWYLEGALREVPSGEAHEVLPQAYAHDELQEFRGLGFADLLDRWD